MIRVYQAVTCTTETPDNLAAYVAASPRTIIVDIRRRTGSGPAWSMLSLLYQYQDQYIHMPGFTPADQFGGVRAAQLRDPKPALELILRWLAKGVTPIFLSLSERHLDIVLELVKHHIPALHIVTLAEAAL